MFLIVFKVKHNITCSKLCFNCLASFLRPSASFLNDHILCLHVVMSQSPYWLLSSVPKFNTMIINSMVINIMVINTMIINTMVINNTIIITISGPNSQKAVRESARVKGMVKLQRSRSLMARLITKMFRGVRIACG